MYTSNYVCIVKSSLSSVWWLIMAGDTVMSLPLSSMCHVLLYRHGACGVNVCVCVYVLFRQGVCGLNVCVCTSKEIFYDGHYGVCFPDVLCLFKNSIHIKYYFSILQRVERNIVTIGTENCTQAVICMLLVKLMCYRNYGFSKS